MGGWSCLSRHSASTLACWLLQLFVSLHEDAHVVCWWWNRPPWIILRSGIDRDLREFDWHGDRTERGREETYLRSRSEGRLLAHWLQRRSWFWIRWTFFSVTEPAGRFLFAGGRAGDRRRRRRWPRNHLIFFIIFIVAFVFSIFFTFLIFILIGWRSLIYSTAAIYTPLANRDGSTELRAGAVPGSWRLADVAEESPGMLGDEEVSAMNLGIAVATETGLIGVAVDDCRRVAELAYLHFFQLTLTGVSCFLLLLCSPFPIIPNHTPPLFIFIFF